MEYRVQVNADLDHHDRCYYAPPVLNASNDHGGDEHCCGPEMGGLCRFCLASDYRSVTRTAAHIHMRIQIAERSSSKRRTIRRNSQCLVGPAARFPSTHSPQPVWEPRKEQWTGNGKTPENTEHREQAKPWRCQADGTLD